MLNPASLDSASLQEVQRISADLEAHRVVLLIIKKLEVASAVALLICIAMSGPDDAWLAPARRGFAERRGGLQDDAAEGVERVG
eukprot:2677334-Rhodomonas_salina.4